MIIFRWLSVGFSVLRNEKTNNYTNKKKIEWNYSENTLAHRHYVYKQRIITRFLLNNESISKQ